MCGKSFRQCIALTFDLANGGNVLNPPPFNLNFQPDEMIVRQATYATGAGTTNNVNLVTNMTEQPILCTVQAQLSQMTLVDAHFSLRNYTNRSYNFQVIDSITSALFAVGVLTVLLEFVKHE